jgi:hypothetical protein
MSTTKTAGSATIVGETSAGAIEWDSDGALTSVRKAAKTAVARTLEADHPVYTLRYGKLIQIRPPHRE